MGFRSQHISTIAGMCFADDSESIYDISLMKKEGNQTSLPTTIQSQIPTRKEGNFMVFPHLKGPLPQKETLDQIPVSKKKKK